MFVYIAGPLSQSTGRKFIEKIDALCKQLNLETFLPHRDVGLVEFTSDIPKAFQEDVKALNRCDLVIASFNHWRIGAGTSWELGYAYAKGKKIMGIKTDAPREMWIPDLSAMILGSMYICTSLHELEQKLLEIKKASALDPA